MKTVIDLVDSVYELLNVSAVNNVITGEVYLDSRPDNSILEDVVINSLPVTGEQLQRAVVNVNIHVPNLQLTINGQPDTSQPNRKRIKVISDIVIPLIKDAIINDTLTGIQNITMINDKELKEHFLNIRVNTYSINL